MAVCGLVGPPQAVPFIEQSNIQHCFLESSLSDTRDYITVQAQHNITGPE